MRPSSIVKLEALLRRFRVSLALKSFDNLDDGFAVLLNERPRLVVRDHIEVVLVLEVLAVESATLPRILGAVLALAEASDCESPDTEDVAEVDVVFRHDFAWLRPVPPILVTTRLLEHALEPA